MSKVQNSYTGKYQVGESVRVAGGGQWVQSIALILEVNPDKKSHNYRVGVDPQYFKNGLWFSEDDLSLPAVPVAEPTIEEKLPQSPQYPTWEKMDRQEQNTILKQHGYRWIKYTQRELDDNDDFETTPGWHLYAGDGREVDVSQAFDEINRGRDTVLAEIEAQKRADKLDRERRRQVKAGIEMIAKYIREYGEKPENADWPQGETFLDSRNIYGVGEAFVIEPDSVIWHLIKNGMDGDNWSRNNLPGHIAFRLSISTNEDELNEYGNGNQVLANAIRQLADGQPLEFNQLSAVRGK